MKLLMLILIPVRNYLDDSYRYTFGGKEEQPELGLNWLDFHARNYMPDLGRWLNPDPLAEEYSSWSPYNYVMNSPLRNIDPTGAFSITLTGQDAQNYMERLINDIKNNEDNNKDVLTANLNDFLANGGGEESNSQDSDKNNPQQKDFRNGFFDGFGRGIRSTVDFFSSLGTTKGWTDLGKGMLDLATIGCQFCPEGMIIRNQLAERTV